MKINGNDLWSLYVLNKNINSLTKYDKNNNYNKKCLHLDYINNINIIIFGLHRKNNFIFHENCDIKNNMIKRGKC